MKLKPQFRLTPNKKGKKMSNYKHVKSYEQKQKAKGLKRQKAWIPDTQQHRTAFLKFATQLREEFLQGKEE